MKANELRIGNLILLTKDNFKTTKEYRLDGIDIYKLNESECIDIKPMPLTEEWFAKLGMTYYSLPTKSNRIVGYYTLKYGNRFKINSSDNSYSFLNFRKEIKYVHELQNLYFALTNEELEIK